MSTEAPPPPAAPRAVLHTTDLSEASELAFAHALRVALNARAKFYILHTQRDQPKEIDWSAFPGVRSTLARWNLLDAGSPPEAVFDRLGVKIRKIDIIGNDPVDGIVRFFNGHPSDLVVLATHGRDGAQRWLHRSVAEPLARQVSVPALFLPPGARGFVDAATGEVVLRRILMPLAGDPLPGPALSQARLLALTLGIPDAELMMLHVGEAEDPPMATIPDGSFGRAETLTRRGSVVDAIIETAHERDADLIVMATKGHQGFLDALRGSTTEQVLRRAGCAVLAVPAI